MAEPTFADLLRRLRKGMRATQEEMGRMLGVSRQTYKNWEYGQANPPRETVQRLESLGLGHVEAFTPGPSPGLDAATLLRTVTVLTVQIPYAGSVPTSEAWGDPLASAEHVTVDAKFGGPKRFAARVVGSSCWPALQQGDLTVWEHDHDPAYGRIVLTQRKGDHGCTVKQLVWDGRRAVLKPVHPESEAPEDVEGWGVIARLTGVVRKADGPEKTWYFEEGLRADHLV